MLRPIGAQGAQGVAQKKIFRLTVEMFIYKWLLLVIGEIISTYSIYYRLPLVNQIEFSHIAYQGG